MTRIYVHPLPIRLWHWINAIGFVALIVTGLQIRYGAATAMSFGTAIDVHNAIGFLLIANYGVWLVFYLLSDKITVYHPELNPTTHYRNVMRQLSYYGYGIFKGHPNPHHVSAYRKFNALQSMSYQIVMMVLVPLQFYTGVVLWDLKRFAGTVELLGGARVVDSIHVVLCIVFVVFILVHVYLTTLGRTASEHVKAMFTGYEEVEDPLESASFEPDAPRAEAAAAPRAPPAAPGS
jgi:thiosulfate reductase cytochrome b subunit